MGRDMIGRGRMTSGMGMEDREGDRRALEITRKKK